MYTVYLHICPNGKRYYGSTKQSVNNRWRSGKAYKFNRYFTDDINKYGWNNIQHIIIAKGLSKNEALWLEEELTREWKNSNPDKSYNIDFGNRLSEETKKKVGEANKGKYVSEETKKKISDAMVGKNNPMYGKYRENHPMYGKQGKSNPKSKSVICITTKRIFYSTSEGAKYYSFNKSGITRCCKGEQKSSGKYKGEKLIWRYLVWNHNKTYRIKGEC